MFTYDFTYASTFTDDFFFAYVSTLEVPYEIVGIKAKDHKYVEITTDRELTGTEQTELNDLIQNYSDFNKRVIDENTLAMCKAWGRSMIDEFELKNMQRKDNGLLARQELADIMAEIHDSFVFICMLEGSLDTLHGILNGYPEQTLSYEDGTTKTWAARAPFSFQHTWQEDLDWIKSELNLFLSTL